MSALHLTLSVFRVGSEIEGCRRKEENMNESNEWRERWRRRREVYLSYLGLMIYMDEEPHSGKTKKKSNKIAQTSF